MNRRHRLFLWPALAFWGCTAHVDAPRARDLATTTSRPAQPTTTEAAVVSPPATVVVESLPETTVPSTAAIGRDSTTVMTALPPDWISERESHDDYTAVNANGHYGKWQFSISTWDATAVAAGRLDLVGVRPDMALPADQDAMAAVLWASGAGCANWGAC